jgi:hypothetical protein
MKYHETETEVQLGDSVIYKHLFWGKSTGVVAYIPGLSLNPKEIEYYDTPDWVVKLSGGKCVFMFYSSKLEFAHPRIQLVTRGEPPAICSRKKR